MLSIVKLRLLSLRDNYMVFLVMTAMALGFTAVFGISFNTYRPSVIIVDEDNTPIRQNLLKSLNKTKYLNLLIRIRKMQLPVWRKERYLPH